MSTFKAGDEIVLHGKILEVREEGTVVFFECSDGQRLAVLHTAVEPRSVPPNQAELAREILLESIRRPESVKPEPEPEPVKPATAKATNAKPFPAR